MPAPKRPSLESEAEMNALKRLRLELADALARNHLEVDAAKTMLDNAHQALKTAETTRRTLEERLRVATGQIDSDDRKAQG